MVGRSSVLAIAVIGGTSLGAVAWADDSAERTGVEKICAAGPDAALVKARRLRGEAAVTAANVWSNPSLYGEHQRSLNGPTEYQSIVGLSVPLGIGGRHFVLQEASEAERERSDRDAELGLVEAALAFRADYVAAVIAQARADALLDQQKALDGLSAIIAGLAKGGEAAEYDRLRQETEGRTHRRHEASARARAESAWARVRAWLDTTSVLPPARLQDLAGGSAADRPFDVTNSAHPALLALDAEVRAQELVARAAGRQWVPDLSLFAGYREVSVGADAQRGVALSLTVPITFFDHGQGEAAVAEARAAEARAELDILKRRLGAQLEATRLQLATLGPSLEGDDVSHAEALRKKAAALYQAGESSITDVLEAFRASEEAQLAYLELAEEVALLRLSRMSAAGSFFDPELDKACRASGGKNQ